MRSRQAEKRPALHLVSQRSSRRRFLWGEIPRAEGEGNQAVWGIQERRLVLDAWDRLTDELSL